MGFLSGFLTFLVDSKQNVIRLWTKTFEDVILGFCVTDRRFLNQFLTKQQKKKSTDQDTTKVSALF